MRALILSTESPPVKTEKPSVVKNLNPKNYFGEESGSADVSVATKIAMIKTKTEAGGDWTDLGPEPEINFTSAARLLVAQTPDFSIAHGNELNDTTEFKNKIGDDSSRANEEDDWLFKKTKQQSQPVQVQD